MPYDENVRNNLIKSLQGMPESPVKGDLIKQMLQQYDLQNPRLEGKFDKYIDAEIQDLPMYEFLSQYLKGGVEKGMPYKADLLQSATGAIRGQYDQASRGLADNLSSRGLGSSGVGLVAQNQLQGQESGALNQATTNINAQDIQFRQDAIAKLLGLSSGQAQFGLQQKGQSLGALQYLYGAKQQANEYQMGYDQRQRLAEMEFYSNLMGGAGSAIGAGIGHGGGYNYGGGSGVGYSGGGVGYA